MFLLYHAYVYLEFLILVCTIYILAPEVEARKQKEIARLRRELRDAQDALDVLKKAINILGK